MAEFTAFGAGTPWARRRTIRRAKPSRTSSPQATLGYFWPIHDVDTDVMLALAPGDTGTKLSLAHHVTGIESERIDRWFGGKSSVVEPNTGGRYVLNWTHKVNGQVVADGPTRILEIVPDKRLVLDWPD